MRCIRNRLLVLLVYFFGVLSIKAQHKEGNNSKNKILLSDALKKLESQFNVRFSYLDVNIQDLVIDEISFSSIELAVIYLQENTPLFFDIIGQRYITLIKKDSENLICGKIVNSQGDAIQGIMIQVADDHNSFSGKKGIFYTKKKEGYIKINHLSYFPQKVPISVLDSSCKTTIYLNERIEELNEVVLKNYMIKGIDKRMDGSFDISPRKLGNISSVIEPDILKNLQLFPGIYSTDETISNINIRGGYNDQTIVLWEGARIYQTGIFFGLISAFNPYVIDNVLFIKNGTPALYGNAVSGTIDLMTSGIKPNKFSGSVGLNFLMADGFLKIPISKKLGVSIAIRRSITDGFKSKIYDEYFNRVFRNTAISRGDYLVKNKNDLSYYDLNIKLFYDLNEKNKLRGEILNIGNEFFLGQQEEESGMNIQDTKNSQISQKNSLIALTWLSQPRDDIYFKISPHYSWYNLIAQDKNLIQSTNIFQGNGILDYGIKAYFVKKIGNKMNFLLGYSFSNIKVTNFESIDEKNITSDKKNILNQHSNFYDITYKSKKHFIRGGIRFNYLSDFNLFFTEPRFSYQYNVTDELSLKLQGEAKSQVISQTVNLYSDFFGVENRRWVLANNKDTPMLKAQQISFGADYQKESILISTDFFKKFVSSITTTNKSLGIFSTSEDTVDGNYDSYGAELLFNYQGYNFNGFASYAYTINDYSIAQSQITFPNNNDVRHSLSVAMSYRFKKLTFGFGVNYRTGIPYTPVNIIDNPSQTKLTEIPYQAVNSGRLSDYIRFDTSLKYKLNLSKKIKCNLGLSILNLLDHKNTLNISYQLNASQTDIFEVSRKSIGFSPNLMLRVNF